MSTGFLSKLNWRHATKAFDASKPVPQEQLDRILNAVRMAPTSFGLQPFHVHVVTNSETKQKMSEAGWKQKQFSTATCVLAFTNYVDVPKRITQLIELSSGGDPAKKEQLKGYESMMRGFFEKSSPEQLRAWADRQAYIALGFAMAACAELEIDSCPMEGFVPAMMDKVLGLPSDEHVSVLLTIGYRDPTVAIRPKVRFPEKDLFSFNS